MHKETKIKFSSFKKIKCPDIKGIECPFCNKVINYQDLCYKHPTIKIYSCPNCYGNTIKKLKYNNQPTEYKGGLFDSKLEVKYVKSLDLQKMSGLIKDYKTQVKIEINVKYIDGNPILTTESIKELKNKGIKSKHLANYYIDFVIINNDGSVKYVETKGFETQLWKLKFNLMEAILTNADIEVVKEKNSYKKK